MAKGNAVWGIDIGQCALKALKCRAHETDADQLVVESFDFIEYEKILTQPEANPDELVADALEQFLSRNEIAGDKVAISVAGQSGLARFIKLPPVESKKIPDIVKYEARQQIPFSLEDVVWDYQQLTGGSEEDEFALEPEVGLFAMKRDQVARALKPLEDAGIDVEYIQLAPLAVYNYVCFDRLGDLRDQPYNPEDPPPSTVVIAIGTDTTDLVVTNGYRVWQRNIPIGGSHFTRALSKELKLTFAKAEHLKRNATQADDPKAVFQAMRPVFSDLLAEIQRSLGYFKSIDKTAKIGDVIALGNAVKLPGLQRYLAQNLEQPVNAIEEFNNLSAGSVSGTQVYKDNILSFAPAYGLCVQALGKAEIATNLLPEEIVRTRLIRAKKPWAVAGAAAILAGLAFNYVTHVSAWSETRTDAMQKALGSADRIVQKASGLESTRSENHANFDEIKELGEDLVSNVEGRLSWLELTKAINAALPRDTRKPEDRKETAEDIMSREEIHIVAMDQKYFESVADEWFSLVEADYQDKRFSSQSGGGESEAGAEEPLEEDYGDSEAEGGEGMSGPGWVIQLTCYHYHNKRDGMQRKEFVNETFIKQLEEGTVQLPDGTDDALIDVPIADLGISYPYVAREMKLVKEIKNPDEALLGSGGRRRAASALSDYGDGGEAEGEEESKDIELERFNFVVQFAWTPKTRRERVEIRAAREAAEAAAQEAAAAESDEVAVN
ncbi:type IV pilus assembly protein PilM [Adhaeretor mobilis]|uniref:Competence protein A n=1 Tax=Adhaeretor mobilis TaxID=1930276 RepID=A0A517MSY3_9BACT|nr:type IV pilus assembly protein PilM [Adhaeretor mobilis]QDS97994.1 Competence protein A [Adhaeretor mobilis]